MRFIFLVLTAIAMWQVGIGTPAKSGATRTIHFPPKSIGKAYALSSTDPVAFLTLGGIKGRFIGSACGTYVIPANEKVLLEIDPAAAENPSRLNGLDPNAAFGIRANYADTDDNFLRAISKLTALYQLDMRECSFSEQGLAALSQLKNLERLSIEGCQIQGSCGNGLHDFKKLRLLNISGCHVSPDTVAKLFHLPQIEYLALARCGISNESLKEAASPKHLKFLDLNSNAAITSSGLDYLRSCRSLTNLRVQFTGIRAHDLLRLKGFPLILIDVHESSLSNAEFKQLRDAFPGCKIALAKKNHRAISKCSLLRQLVKEKHEKCYRHLRGATGHSRVAQKIT